MENKEKSLETIENLKKRLKNCDLCPRNCRIDRIKGKKGYCGMDARLVIYTAFLHRGEEPAITGERGSGTIFFSGCSLKCVYCQNYQFSHNLEGKVISEKALAGIMLQLQEEGAHNINLVTPTHFLPQILQALFTAKKRGLSIPVVYNTSGYEKREIIEKLSDFVDIYLVDTKYINSDISAKYSLASNYPDFNKESVKEMHRQKKPLWNNNILQEGLIIRHLLLPGHLNEAKSILLWIKKSFPSALVSIMSQYQPYHRASEFIEIARPLNYEEYRTIKDFVEELKLNGWIQGFRPVEKLAGIHFKPST